MNILAIDPGTKCGWAYVQNDKFVASGVETFELGRGDSRGIRFFNFRFWFKGMLSKVKPNLVIYERPLLYGGAATDLLVGFVTRLQEECDLRKIEYQAVSPVTLKKEATGSGRADKNAMKRAAELQWGRHPVNDDNEADALNLLAYAFLRNIDEEAPGE